MLAHPRLALVRCAVTACARTVSVRVHIV